MDCDAAYHYCEMELYIPIRTQLGRESPSIRHATFMLMPLTGNPYDMSKMCVDGAVKGTCYAEAGQVRVLCGTRRC
jgi:hypothetical protein